MFCVSLLIFIAQSVLVLSRGDLLADVEPNLAKPNFRSDQSKRGKSQYLKQDHQGSSFAHWMRLSRRAPADVTTHLPTPCTFVRKMSDRGTEAYRNSGKGTVNVQLPSIQLSNSRASGKAKGLVSQTWELSLAEVNISAHISHSENREPRGWRFFVSVRRLKRGAKSQLKTHT